MKTNEINQELSLAKLYPALARQFHPELNGFVRPSDVRCSNRSDVWWWKCETGHEWKDKIANRLFNSACPKCVLYSNSLAKKYPQLLKEWDYERNVDVNPEEIPFDNRSKKFYWKCSNGHSYPSTVRARTLGKEECHSCPKSIELMIEEYPEIAKYWSEEGNFMSEKNKVPAASKLCYVWKCDSGHLFKATIKQMLEGHKCEKCLIKEQSLQQVNPKLASEWSSIGNPKKPNEVLFNSKTKYWWECQKHYKRWRQAPIERIQNDVGCPICDIENNSLEKKFPELASEWDYELNPSLDSPMNVTPNNYKNKVWWKCSSGHPWAATVKSRLEKKVECSECVRENKTLADVVSEDLYSEWVSYLNGGKVPEDIKSDEINHSYWWMCKDRGHLELETVYSRKRKPGCKKCEEEKISLAFNVPIEVLNEWDINKNERTPLEVYYKSSKLYWWVDAEGNSYLCSPQEKNMRYSNKK